MPFNRSLSTRLNSCPHLSLTLSGGLGELGPPGSPLKVPRKGGVRGGNPRLCVPHRHNPKTWLKPLWDGHPGRPGGTGETPIPQESEHFRLF
jgi:hypothetical protein